MKLRILLLAAFFITACATEDLSSRPFPYGKDFIVGILSNNAGLTIPNVIAQSGDTYVITRFFGPTASVLCTNLTEEDVCYDIGGNLVGASDTALQMTFAKTVLGRTFGKEHRLKDVTGMHFEVPDIAGKEFVSSEMLPPIFDGIDLPKQSVRANSCEKRTSTDAEEITCVNHTLMPYYAYVEQGSLQGIVISESLFFYGEGITRGHLEQIVQSYLAQSGE